MAVAQYPEQMTVEEFETYPFPDGKIELVRGEPRVMPPAGGAHGGIVANLLERLIPFVKQNRLGRVLGDGVGYELLALPRTVRNPDAAFVRASRLPPEGLGRGFLKVAPDLAVEVLSPSERAWELQEKIRDYFEAGTHEIWVIDPRDRSVMIVPAEAAIRSLDVHQMLEGSLVLPGFQMAVAELFEGIAP